MRFFTFVLLTIFMFLLVPFGATAAPVPAPTAAPLASQRPSGPVFGWGANGKGQLGTGSTSFTAGPLQAQGLSDAVMLAAGVEHSLALLADGTVWTWGAGNARPVQVPGLSGVVVISAGTGHNLALKEDGTVWAWGGNDFGELGDGTTTPRNTPVRVQGLNGVTAIAAGNLFSLAVTSDGTAWSWGYNNYGQLGDGSTTTRGTPRRVAGLGEVLDVDAGAHFGMALKRDGTVWTWGRNDQGQLGNGTSKPVGAGSTTPVNVNGVAGATWISAGSEFALALAADGTVWAWGENERGQLGNGQSGGVISVQPTPVAQMPGRALMVAAGDDHSLALLEGGRVAAWGTNFFGELGTGQRTTTGCWCQPLPVESAVDGMAWVAAGREHTLALRAATGTGTLVPAGDDAPPAADDPVPVSGGEPPAGMYGCITFYSGNYAGNLEIQGGGFYVWYDEPGFYEVDGATGGITWLSGPAADLGVGGEYRAPGSPHPAGPGQVYAEPTIVLTGTAGSQEGDLISCQRES